jgi:hypothetical protein
MKSQLFNLVGIAAPGRCDIRLNGRFQIVELSELSDKELIQLFRDGCPYIEPTPAGIKALYPDLKPIVTESLGSQPAVPTETPGKPKQAPKKAKK